MKSFLPSTEWFRLTGAFRATAGLLAAGWLLAGCATNETRYLALDENFQVTESAKEQDTDRQDNVFLQSTVLPRNVRRVVVLPLACDGQRPELNDACQMLDPVLQAELTRTRKFEIIPVGRDVLRIRTGRVEWTGSESMPANFFESLREVYAADAVMFCELTAYHGYPPLMVGWRLKLVEARTRQTLWAGDEIFNAATPEQHASMWRWLQGQFKISPGNIEEWRLQSSPRQFGQYTAAMLLGTLPNR